MLKAEIKDLNDMGGDSDKVIKELREKNRELEE